MRSRCIGASRASRTSHTSHTSHTSRTRLQFGAPKAMPLASMRQPEVWVDVIETGAWCADTQAPVCRRSCTAGAMRPRSTQAPVIDSGLPG